MVKKFRRKAASHVVPQLTGPASRCRRAYILPMCLFIYFFFFFFSTTNLWGHWNDLNQTWTHIHLWLLFEKFGPNSPGIYPPRAGGKKRFLGPTLNFDRRYLCNETWYQQSEKIVNLQWLPTCPQIWWTLVHKGLRTVGDFLPTP